MAKIAILGYGTVGSGVLEVLRRSAVSIQRRANEPIEVKYICDIRDFSKSEDAKLFVNNIDVILRDPEVRVVVETIGGIKPAYFYVKSALESGRHVVTSNKEMVAQYGAELLALAKKNNVCFLFEASVGGGTPIITPMHQCLAANELRGIAGIVNGTTNFMLTRMSRDKMSFDEALKIAQGLGYAETIDPSADVDGIDAGRKIAILSSLAFGHHIYPDNVPMRGIRDVTVTDMNMAARLQCAIKLIAWADNSDELPFACGVEPMLVPLDNYGKGAGKLPTASAVAADIIDAVKNGAAIHDSLFWHEALPIDGKYVNEAKGKYYIRACTSKDEALKAFGNIEVISEAEELVFIADNITAAQLEKIKTQNSALHISNAMRFMAQ
ncbi:MAG: homoserine dehydrogenase, partial [Oscillospiraceae bacterium]